MSRTVLAALLVLLLTTSVEAAVTSVEITRREPFAGGHAFEGAGAYEKVVGRFHGELDPAHPMNRGIVDLDLAPRNARGRVEYVSDFYILRPVDLTRGNGALLYDVNNRGRKYALVQHNSGVPADDPSTSEHAGNGFLMRHGFTVVWSGWIPGAAARPHDLKLEVPSARGAGGVLEQLVWDDFLFNSATVTEGRLAFATADRGSARLLVHERVGQPPATLAPTQWEFTDDRTIRLLPAGTPFRIGTTNTLV